MIGEGWKLVAAFIEARLAEEEWWAREASRDEMGKGQTVIGERWHWVNDYTDAPIALDPAIDETLLDLGDVSLRSVETYRSRNGSVDLPHFVIDDGGNTQTTVAGHILRHDPHKVMRRIVSARHVADHCTGILARGKRDLLAEEILTDLAAGWDWHPDYESWLR